MKSRAKAARVASLPSKRWNQCRLRIPCLTFYMWEKAIGVTNSLWRFYWLDMILMVCSQFAWNGFHQCTNPTGGAHSGPVVNTCNDI